MSAVIGALRGVLSLDSAAFEAGARRAEASMSDLQRKLTRAGGDLKRVGRNMSAAITAPLVGAATVAVRSSLKVIDAQAKMAQSLGTTVVSMQNLERAADLAGISSEQLEGSLRRMTRRISAAEQDTGPAVKALQQLGLAASDLNDLPVDARVEKITTAIRTLIPEAEQAGIASQIFGDQTGLAIMRLDTDVLARGASEVQRFGVAVSEIDADRIEAANDAMSALGLVSRGISNQLAVALAPTLQAAAEKVQALAQWFNELTPETQRTIATVTALAAALGPATIAIGLMATGLAALASPIGLVVLGLGVAAGAAVYLAANWDGLRQRFPALTGGFEALAQSLQERFGNALAQAEAGMRAVSDLIDGDWSSAWKNFLAAIQGIDAPFNAAIKNILKLVGALPQDLVALGRDAIAGFVEGIREQWEAVKEDVLSIFRFEGYDTRSAGERLGIDLTGGVAIGIAQGRASSEQEMRDYMRGLEGAARDESETQSPSRVFMRIGRDLMGGLAEGIGQSAAQAADAARAAAAQVAASVSARVDSLTSALGDMVVFGEFREGLDRIVLDFQRAISRMIATAAANPIKLALGATGVGGVGGSVLGGGGGLGGSLINGLLGGIPAAFGAGVGNFTAGIVSGGLGGGFGAAAAQIGQALAAPTLTSIAGAIGTVALPIAAIAGIAALTRKRTETINEGISFRVMNDQELLQSFKKTRTSTMFGAGKYGTRFRPLKGEALASLSGPLQSGLSAIAAIGAQVGMPNQPQFLYRNDVDLRGKSEAERAQLIEQAIAGAMEAAAAAYFDGEGDRFFREGETAVQALNRMATALSTVNGLWRAMGQDMLEVTRPSADIASRLAEQIGGLDALTSAMGTYYEAFFSETEREQNLRAEVIRQLGEVNIAMPDTRDAFRSIVESLDLSTDAGRTAYTTMLSVAGAFAELTPALEGAGAAAAQAARQARVAEVEDARQVVAQRAQAGLAAAEQALRTAFAAESDKIRSAASEAVARVEGRMSGAIARGEQRVAALGGLRDTLRDAILSRQVLGALDDAGAYRRSAGYVRAVAAGTAALDTARLQQAMQVIAQPSAQLFGSFVEYQREFAANTAALQAIEERTGGQMSAAERTVREISDSRDAQVAAIEEAAAAQLAALGAQLGALLGVQGGVVSLSQAISNFRTAQAEAQAAGPVGTGAGFQSGSFGAWLNDTYRDLLGRDVRAEGLSYWSNDYINGATLEQIRANIAISEEARRFAETGIPRFAAGGMHLGGLRLVGEQGPELEATGPSRIFSARQTQEMLGGGDRLVSEIAALRSEMAEIRRLSEESERHLEEMRDIEVKWDRLGLPATAS